MSELTMLTVWEAEGRMLQENKKGWRKYVVSMAQLSEDLLLIQHWDYFCSRLE